jgi:hypothetical protein
MIMTRMRTLEKQHLVRLLALLWWRVQPLVPWCVRSLLVQRLALQLLAVTATPTILTIPPLVQRLALPW